MNTQRTSATVAKNVDQIRVSPAPDDVAVIRARDPEELAIPNATALSAINRRITSLAQQMMDVAHQQSKDHASLAKAEALLAEARRQLAAIRTRSMANPRVRASLAGARTGLLTAAREVREQLIRHGSAVDEIGE